MGSQRSEQIESNTFDMVSAGDHCDLRMSRQIEPFEFMFGWYMRVVNATCKQGKTNLEFVKSLIFLVMSLRAEGSRSILFVQEKRPPAFPSHITQLKMCENPRFSPMQYILADGRHRRRYFEKALLLMDSFRIDFVFYRGSPACSGEGGREGRRKGASCVV